jgi:hypothetical protein
MFTVKSITRRNLNCNEIGWCTVFMLIIAMLTMAPLLIVGKASKFPILIKYRDTVLQTCYGGNQIQDMSITPAIYNTTLTYYPAFLHLTTTTFNQEGLLVTVRLTYPTYFETTFDCECPEKGCAKKPCNKMVGDVITKYNELRDELTFPCYVYGDQVVGLAGEHSEIVKYYRLTLAGILFGVLYSIWFLYLVCVHVCINYVPTDDIKDNQDRKYTIPGGPYNNKDAELADSVGLIKKDSEL